MPRMHKDLLVQTRTTGAKKFRHCRGLLSPFEHLYILERIQSSFYRSQARSLSSKLLMFHSQSFCTKADAAWEPEMRYRQHFLHSKWAWGLSVSIVGLRYCRLKHQNGKHNCGSSSPGHHAGQSGSRSTNLSSLTGTLLQTTCSGHRNFQLPTHTL